MNNFCLFSCLYKCNNAPLEYIKTTKQMERINLSLPKDLVRQLENETPWNDRGGKQAVVIHFLRLGLKCHNKMLQLQKSSDAWGNSNN